MKETLHQGLWWRSKALEDLPLPTPEGTSHAFQDVSDLTQQEIKRSVAIARRVLRDEPFALGLFEVMVAVYEQRLAVHRKKAQESKDKLRDFGGLSEFPEPRWNN